MKIIKFLAVIMILFASVNAMCQIQTFPWQGVQRQYLVRTPSECENAMPVLFFLHGLGDNITRLDNEFHFQQVANDFGWMVVIPQALNEGNGTMWNAALISSTTDDSGFLMALVDSLAVQYPINQDSIFFTGFSMGGFMSHRMAIEHGDRINACAPVSGLITHTMANHTPVAPVRMLHIHGTTDPVVGYDGNSQYFGGNLGLSVENILDYWKNANGCTNDAVIDTLPDLKNDGLLFVRYTYECDTELQHIKVIGGNHSWYHSASQYDISYMDEIHKFFTGKNGYDVIGEKTTGSLDIYPNPISDKVIIRTEKPSTIEIIDIQGQTVFSKKIESGETELDIHLPKGVYLVKDEYGASMKMIKK